MSLRTSDMTRMAYAVRATAGVAIVVSMTLRSSVAFAVTNVSKDSTPKKSQADGLVQVVTAMSTPLKSGHPILILNRNTGADEVERLATRLQFPTDQRYSKWSVIFDAPIRVESVLVQTCEGTMPFADGVELYVDYNEKRIYRDGGQKTVKFNVKTDARALTLNFLESAGLCLERISIVSETEWLRPRTLESQGSLVVADGSLGVGTRTIKDAKKKSKMIGDRKAGEWNLRWQNPLIVESLRIWNGDQNLGNAFESNDRVRELDIRADGGKPQRVTLADRRDSQQIALKEPHEIRSLELKAISTYPGTQTTEPVLGEVQLSAGGENWFPTISVSSLAPVDYGESAEAALVRERGYGDILDRELRTGERGDIWKFRFRSDGTFFARIFVEKTRTARGWSVSGVWHLGEQPSNVPELKVSKARSLLRAFTKSKGVDQADSEILPGLVLTLTGMKIATSDSNDSLPCANQCFLLKGVRDQNFQRELPVDDQVELQRERRAQFILRNRTEPEGRTLEFTDLKLRVHSLYD